ncbi:hypothetical protein POL68_29980 [Stigmatella sp. ncwal1]|uniref:Uncharacterized protein n=1 Tax=Stigmatella ashevillensis TaxID=2995309 RepID=A0ABT5DGL1_9BACT|nr:hypothetical protein [Stigmatella ashevillena]MDC0712729.1 hypothetical protein [Stigmatella ashevillena]
MQGRPGGWENELLVAYLLPTGPVAAYNVPLVGGAFLWGGKVYRQNAAAAPGLWDLGPLRECSRW